MKFAEHLSAHITPEWRKQYISYESMKEMVYRAVEQAPSIEMGDEEALERYFPRFDETFFQYADKELVKINAFFAEKLAEATRKFTSLQSDLTTSEMMDPVHPPSLRRRKGGVASDEQRHHHFKKSLHDIKLAFSEFYLSLILLQNYQTLNFTGFRKILKKHDKLLSTERGAKWRQANVETATFYTNKEVDHLIKETENVFTLKLEGGDRGKAMKRLRVPPLGEQQNPWTTFRIGLFAGIYLVLLVVGVLTAFFHGPNIAQRDWEVALCIYRGVFLVILCIFFLGINTYGWRSSGVNHVLIFEIDPRNNLTHQQLLEVACFFAVVWGLSVLTYLFGDFLLVYQPMLKMVFPLCLVGFSLIYLLNPIKILHYKARRWLLRVLFRIFTAPFHKVGFADFWLADQLNSLTQVLLDFEFLICYYAIEAPWWDHRRLGVCGTVKYGIRPIVSCLPAWWRFAQCLRRYRDTRLVFPHIINAGKYSTTFFVVLFSSLHSHHNLHQDTDTVDGRSPYFYMWVIAALISTTYTLTWDIKMDWGLLDKNAGENRFLREEVVYAHRGYYYFAIVEDLILRLAWTLNVSIGQMNLVHGAILSSVLSSCEVFRRFIWNFFRLENEHLNNCGQFRAVRDISIAPLQANDAPLLEEMMDDEEGVTHRKEGRRKGSENVHAGSEREPLLIYMEDQEEEEEEEEEAAAAVKEVIT